jgi:O-antigen ligase
MEQKTMIRLKKISPINALLFMYIVSIYLFTYREGYTVISNMLALILMGSVWIDFLMNKKKLVINLTLVAFLLFIVVCALSAFYAVNPSLVYSKVMTLLLVFVLILSVGNYLDTVDKIEKTIHYFVYGGFIASIYIFLNADFTEVTRFGSQLGNVNAIGIIIGISDTFAFYLWLTERKFRHLIMLVAMLPIILITGSRKALFFIIFNFLIILFLRSSSSLMKIIKFMIISGLGLIVAFYLIYHVKLLYEILGTRMDNLFAFILGKGTREGSLNARSYMAQFGLHVFGQKPWLGYGIDNYRVLLKNELGSGTYSHNNFIELMVGTGVIGLSTYYLTHLFALKGLVGARKEHPGVSIYYPFIALLLSYTILSISMVYYDDKHISILLAMGSVLQSVFRKDEFGVKQYIEIQNNRRKRHLKC